MGDWKLEVFRMSFYIFFPLTIFYTCNKTDFFKTRDYMGWYKGHPHRISDEVLQENKTKLNMLREKRWKAYEEKMKIKEEEELKILEEKRKAFNNAK